VKEPPLADPKEVRSVANTDAKVVAQRPCACADDRTGKKVAAGCLGNDCACGCAHSGALKVIPLASCEQGKGKCPCDEFSVLHV
jgi:hypothetical protein